MTAKKPVVRTFATGANRDIDVDKLDFEAFLSPLVLQNYAVYMHAKRKLADGSMRDGDNWQKGIPVDAYMKSLARHWQDLWLHHRDLADLAVEDYPTTLAAMMFNVMGAYHEYLKAERAKGKPTAPVAAPAANPATSEPMLLSLE